MFTLEDAPYLRRHARARRGRQLRVLCGRSWQCMRVETLVLKRRPPPLFSCSNTVSIANVMRTSGCDVPDWMIQMDRASYVACAVDGTTVHRAVCSRSSTRRLLRPPCFPRPALCRKKDRKRRERVPLARDSVATTSAYDIRQIKRKRCASYRVPSGAQSRPLTWVLLHFRSVAHERTGKLSSSPRPRSAAWSSSVVRPLLRPWPARRESGTHSATDRCKSLG